MGEHQQHGHLASVLPLLPCRPLAELARVAAQGGMLTAVPAVLACPPACLPARRAWFDVDTFAAALASEGLSVVDGKAAAPIKVPIKEYDSQSKVSALVNYLKKQKRHQHIRWAGQGDVSLFCCRLSKIAAGCRQHMLLKCPGCCTSDSASELTSSPRSGSAHLRPCRIACPAFRIPGALMKRHRGLLQAAAGGLRPSERFQAVMAARRDRLESHTGSSAYNLLHLRVERDWLALCEWWQKPAEGRDNCMNNTDTVGEQLQKHGFETEVRGLGGRVWGCVALRKLCIATRGQRCGGLAAVPSERCADPTWQTSAGLAPGLC